MTYKKRNSLGFAAGLLSLCLGAPAYAVVIDFDTIASNTPVTNQYSELTFSALPLPNHAAPLTWAFGSFGNSLPNGLVGWNGATTSTFSSNLGFAVDFTNPVNNLMFDVFGDNDVGAIASLTIDTLSTSGIVESMVVDGDFGTVDTIDLSSYSNITRVVISDNSDGGGVAFDDFSFDVGTGSSVPVPAPIALVGLGLIGIHLRRRSRT